MLAMETRGGTKVQAQTRRNRGYCVVPSWGLGLLGLLTGETTGRTVGRKKAVGDQLAPTRGATEIPY